MSERERERERDKEKERERDAGAVHTGAHTANGFAPVHNVSNVIHSRVANDDSMESANDYVFTRNFS